MTFSPQFIQLVDENISPLSILNNTKSTDGPPPCVIVVEESLEDLTIIVLMREREVGPLPLQQAYIKPPPPNLPQLETSRTGMLHKHHPVQCGISNDVVRQ